VEDGIGRVQALTEAVEDSMPAVFHVTHWKAGSQWIHKILRQCVLEKIVAPRLGEAQVRHYAIQRGRVYPTVYMTKEDLAKVAPPDAKLFVVIRDLRDTLVFAYFSIKYSHPMVNDEIVSLRGKLLELDQEAGFLHPLDDWLPQCAEIQISWF